MPESQVIPMPDLDALKLGFDRFKAVAELGHMVTVLQQQASEILQKATDLAPDELIAPEGFSFTAYRVPGSGRFDLDVYDDNEDRWRVATPYQYVDRVNVDATRERRIFSGSRLSVDPETGGVWLHNSEDARVRFDSDVSIAAVPKFDSDSKEK